MINSNSNYLTLVTKKKQKMEFRQILPITITLAILGLITSVFSTILVLLMPKTIILHYVLLAICAVFAFLLIFFAFFHNDSERKKRLFLSIGILCIFAAIVAVAIPDDFHYNAHVVNRGAVYFIIIVALQMAVTIWWPLAFDILPFMSEFSAGLDPIDESILFVFTNTILSFCAAFTIGAAAGINDSIVNTRILYTFGIWIASFVLNGGIAVLVCNRGIRSDVKGISTVVDSTPDTTAYDKIA